LNYPTNYVFSAFGQIGAYTPVASGNQLLTLSVVSDNAKIKVNSSPYYKGTDNSTSNAGTTGGTHGKRLGMNYIIKY
jgi:hypothetical protein